MGQKKKKKKKRGGGGGGGRSNSTGRKIYIWDKQQEIRNKWQKLLAQRQQ